LETAAQPVPNEVSISIAVPLQAANNAKGKYMTSRNLMWLLCCALGATLLLSGCGTAQRDATQAAVDAAQKAVSAAQDAADKYAPEQFKAAQDALQSARNRLAKSDYQGALDGAKEAVQKAREAVATAIEKKEQWSRDWRNLNASAPKTLNEAKDKLDAYTKHGKLPPGVSSDQMAEAQAQYEKLKDGWAEITAAYQKGNLSDAMKKAGWLQDGLQKLKELLGIKS
jgi:hypothetical protein